MKSLLPFLILAILVIVPRTTIAATGKSSDTSKPVFVQVRETKLRKTGSYFAPVAATLRYGDELTLLAANDPQWFEVKTNQGAKGFIHFSALSNKKIVPASKAKTFFDSGFDSSEVVLAGKGFNAEVEKQYAASNSALRFDQVNQVEKIKVSEGELRAFLKDGGLSQTRG